jgi:hypothetical protein
MDRTFVMTLLSLTDSERTLLKAIHVDVDVWLAHMQSLIDNGRWSVAEFESGLRETLTQADKHKSDQGAGYKTRAVHKAEKRAADKQVDDALIAAKAARIAADKTAFDDAVVAEVTKQLAARG